MARQASKAVLLPLGLLTRRRPGDVLILLYHRVGPGPSEIELSEPLFDDHLTFLAERERVLSIDDAVTDDGDGGVVVTFDDGSRDFHERALPLLARHRIPAVLYLTTGWVAEEGGAPHGHTSISWSALREAVSTGIVTVGSHTHTHPWLSRLNEEACEEEMVRSKGLVEENLEVACHHFAYPFAVGSPAADRVARRLFRTAALEAWRTNRRGRIDPHRLGRIPVLRNDGRVFFRQKVEGRLNGEGLLYRSLHRGPWRPV